MDLSKLSDKDLEAISAGDISAVSDAGLNILAGKELTPIQQIREQGMQVPDSMTGAARGAVESGAQILTGIPAAAAGGLRGLYGLATGDTAEEAARKSQALQETMTYQPRTQEGQRISQAIGLPIELASKGAGYVGGKIGKAIGNEAAGQTIGEVSPVVAATLYGGAKALSGAQALQAGGGIKTPQIIPESVKDIARTRYEAGQKVLAEKAIQQAVPEAERAKVVSALERRAEPMVPESTVTSADAIARMNREMALKGQPERFGGGLVSMQEQLSKVPETSGQLRTIQLQQETARAKVLAQGAGTEKQYSTAVALRKANAEQNYGAIKDNLVRADQELVGMFSRPSMEKALAKAEQLAREKGDAFAIGGDAGAFPIQSLQYVKMALDDMTKDPKNYGLGATEVKLIGDTRNQFMGWIEKTAKPYADANRAYAIDSQPIQQMDLWRLMQDKFVTPTGKEAPGSYLKALRDQTKLIKDATGYRKGTSVDKIFNTEQSALAARLAAEMEMELVKKRMASEVNVTGVGKFAEISEPQLPRMINTTSTVANWLIKMLGKDANVPVNQFAAEILADPKKTAAVLKQINPDYRPGVLKTFKDIASSKGTLATGSALMENQ